MRVQSGCLALLILGAWGTAASAQSPLMYGMQPYPPYPNPYPQPMPNVAAPQRYAPPAYYPQPQPRIMYVPATPTTWPTGPVPAQPATQPTPVPLALPAPPSSDAVNTVPAKAASLRSSVVVTELDEDCGPDGCHTRPRRLKDDDANWLPKGRWDVQFLGGFYNDLGSAHYNWAQSSVRLGRVWNCECLSCLPGGFEGLIDVNGGYVVDSDFGNSFTGAGVLLRYNLVHLGSRVVPYIQAGVGFQYNDAYRDLNQSYLGSRMELTAQGQIGLRVFVTKSCTIDLEGGFQHISDQGMSTRNDGINAMGGMLGATYFFPCGGRR